MRVCKRRHGGALLPKRRLHLAATSRDALSARSRLWPPYSVFPLLAPTFSPLPANTRTISTASREPQRTYKACSSCRDRKVRCNLDLNGRPPCARCRGQQRGCVSSATPRVVLEEYEVSIALRAFLSRHASGKSRNESAHLRAGKPDSHRAGRGSVARHLQYVPSQDQSDGPLHNII